MVYNSKLAVEIIDYLLLLMKKTVSQMNWQSMSGVNQADARSGGSMSADAVQQFNMLGESLSSVGVFEDASFEEGGFDVKIVQSMAEMAKVQTDAEKEDKSSPSEKKLTDKDKQLVAYPSAYVFKGSRSPSDPLPNVPEQQAPPPPSNNQDSKSSLANATNIGLSAFLEKNVDTKANKTEAEQDYSSSSGESTQISDRMKGVSGAKLRGTLGRSRGRVMTRVPDQVRKPGLAGELDELNAKKKDMISDIVDTYNKYQVDKDKNDGTVSESYEQHTKEDKIKHINDSIDYKEEEGGKKMKQGLDFSMPKTSISDDPRLNKSYVREAYDNEAYSDYSRSSSVDERRAPVNVPTILKRDRQYVPVYKITNLNIRKGEKAWTDVDELLRKAFQSAVIEERQMGESGYVPFFEKFTSSLNEAIQEAKEKNERERNEVLAQENYRQSSKVKTSKEIERYDRERKAEKKSKKNKTPIKGEICGGYYYIPRMLNYVSINEDEWIKVGEELPAPPGQMWRFKQEDVELIIQWMTMIPSNQIKIQIKNGPKMILSPEIILCEQSVNTAAEFMRILNGEIPSGRDARIIRAALRVSYDTKLESKLDDRWMEKMFTIISEKHYTRESEPPTGY